MQQIIEGGCGSSNIIMPPSGRVGGCSLGHGRDVGGGQERGRDGVGWQDNIYPPKHPIHHYK